MIEVEHLPESVESANGEIYFLTSSGHGRVCYEATDGERVEFFDSDLLALIRNSRQ